MAAAVAHKGPAWLRPLINVAPLVAFLATWAITGQFREGTWVLVALTVAALVVLLILDRRVTPITAFSSAMVLGFGGLSLALHNNELLKMKMTISDGILGAIMFGALILKRNPLKRLLDSTISMPDQAWRVLMMRYGVFFWSCAVANEVIRRTQTDAVWGMSRVAAIGAIFLFGAAQIPLLSKYVKDGEINELAEPPDAGF